MTVPPDSGPERTPDGRWIVVDGRRWRASDPAIPERFRTELVAELMDARRAVGTAGRAGDVDAVASARARVQDAKVALGERGPAWWDEPTPDADRARLAAAISALACHRSPGATICPSDAARAVGGDRWRSLMDEARAAARDLAAQGQVEVTQRGAPIDAAGPWRGPVRIRAVVDGAR